MSNLEEYENKFDSVRMRRIDGILEMTFHTNGGSLRWSKKAHEERGNLCKTLTTMAGSGSVFLD